MALMFFLDYFFTLMNYRLYQVKMKSIIETEQFELNPDFQKDVYAGSYKVTHLFWVIIILLAFFLLYKIEITSGSMLGFIGINQPLYLFMFAVLMTGLLFILFQHVRGLLFFKTFNKIPNLVSGHIAQTYRFSLENSKAEALAFTFVFAVIWVLIPSVVTFGFMCGPLVVYFQFQNWVTRLERKK